jgi:hypothetical protein
VLYETDEINETLKGRKGGELFERYVFPFCSLVKSLRICDLWLWTCGFAICGTEKKCISTFALHMTNLTGEDSAEQGG